jgi:hypothetical protein
MRWIFAIFLDSIWRIQHQANPGVWNFPFSNHVFRMFTDGEFHAMNVSGPRQRADTKRSRLAAAGFSLRNQIAPCQNLRQASDREQLKTSPKTCAIVTDGRKPRRRRCPTPPQSLPRQLWQQHA